MPTHAVSSTDHAEHAVQLWMGYAYEAALDGTGCGAKAQDRVRSLLGLREPASPRAMRRRAARQAMGEPSPPPIQSRRAGEEERRVCHEGRSRLFRRPFWPLPPWHCRALSPDSLPKRAVLAWRHTEAAPAGEVGTLGTLRADSGQSPCLYRTEATRQHLHSRCLRSSFVIV